MRIFWLPFLLMTGTLCVAGMSPPASIAVVPSQADGEVTLAWTAVPGASRYTVRRAADSLSPAKILSANQTGTTFVDKAASPGVAARYTVTAVSPAGESDPVAVVAAPSIVMDHGDAGTSSTGEWILSTADSAFGKDSLIARSTGKESPTATYTYLGTLPFRGAYDVYMRWAGTADRSASVPVWVSFDSDSVDNRIPAPWRAGSKGASVLKASVDQTRAAGTWVRVGTALCNGVLSCSVVIRNDTGTERQSVVADAVQFVPRTVNSSAYTISTFGDEFSGPSLDLSKWKIWSRRDSVSQSGGELIFSLVHTGKLRSDGSGYLDESESDAAGERNWIPGGVHAPEFSQAYGYYEVRFRTAQETGVDNAFWMLTHGGGAYDSMELDVPEVWTRPGAHGTTHGAGLGSWRTMQPPLGPGPELRYWTTGKGHKYDATDWTKYHTYGIEWLTDNTVIYYLDGIERWRSPVLPDETPGLDLISSFSPLYPILSTLPMDWMTIRPAAAPGDFPPLHGKTMNVDYIRISQKPGWTGAASGDFSDPANWGPDGVPSEKMAAVFNTAASHTTVILPAGIRMRSLWIDTASAPSFTFKGGPVRLGYQSPGVGGVMMTSQVVNSQTVNASIEALTNLQIANLSSNPAATLTLNGNITAAPAFATASAAPMLFFHARGDILLNAPILAPIGNVHKWGITGSLRLPAGSTFTGELSLENGSLRFKEPSALGGNASQAFVFLPTAKHSESYRPRLTYDGPGGTVDKPLRLSGAAADGILEASGSGPLMWRGDVMVAPIQTASTLGMSNATLVLGGTNAGNNTFSGRIGDAGTGVTNNGQWQPVSLALTKSGPGRWILSGENRIKGNLTISDGCLVVGAGANGTLVTDGSITVKRGILLVGSALGGVGPPLTVGAGAKLGGTGRISRDVAVAGRLRSDALTIAGNVTFEARGGMEAVLSTASCEAGVNVSFADITRGAIVDVIVNAPDSPCDFSEAFWSSPQTFPLLKAASGCKGNFRIGQVSKDSAGRTASGYGAFSLRQSNDEVVLVWTPLPAGP